MWKKVGNNKSAFGTAYLYMASTHMVLKKAVGYAVPNALLLFPTFLHIFTNFYCKFYNFPYNFAHFWSSK
jgi:hypothetical protein